MGWLRAPVCYLDDYAHRWFPWTFSGHWADRVDQPVEPAICRLHSRMQDRYWLKRETPGECQETAGDTEEKQ
jgi:hypothetical protein